MVAHADPQLRRLHALTANFFFWQGLRWVPLGAALLLYTWSTLPSFPLAPFWRDAMPWLSLLGGLTASLAIGAYYDRAYGTVRALTGLHARRDALKWGVVYPAMLLAMLIDGLFTPPLIISGAVFALAIEAYRRSTGGGRRHYVGASLLCAGATFAPMLGLVQPGREALTLVLGGLGGIYLVGGVLDHLELRRLLQVREQDDDGERI